MAKSSKGQLRAERRKAMATEKKQTRQRRPAAHRTQFQVQDDAGNIVAVARSEREANELVQETPGSQVVPSKERIEEAATPAEVRAGADSPGTQQPSAESIQRESDLQALKSYITDDQIDVEAAVQAGVDTDLLERVGVTGDAVSRIRQRMSDMELLQPFTSDDNQIDIQAAVASGVDPAVLSRIGIAGDSVQSAQQRIADVGAVQAYLGEDNKLDIQAALQAGVDDELLKRIGIDDASLASVRQRVADLEVLAPYIANEQVDIQSALEAGVDTDILERIGVDAGSITSSQQSIADMGTLAPFLSEDRQLDVEAALGQGVSEDILQRVGIAPTSIAASRQHITDLAALGPYIEDGQIDIQAALQGGVAQSVLERVGVAGGSIEASRQNISDLEAIEEYLTPERALNVQAAVRAGVPDEVLTRIGIEPTSIASVKQNISDLDVLDPYISDNQIDVQEAISDGVDPAILQRVGVASESIQKINQNISDLALLQPYINDGLINLQDAIQAGVDTEVLARVGVSGESITTVTRNIQDLQALEPYITDDQINVQEAIEGGIDSAVLTRVGVTSEGLLSANQSISDLAAIQPFLSSDGKTVNINAAIDGGVSPTVLGRLGLPTSKPEQVSVLPKPPTTIKVSHINSLSNEFSLAQNAVLRSVAGGQDLNNAQRLAKQRIAEFWRELGYDVAGLRSSYESAERWYPRAISSAQGHISDNLAKVGARRGAISRETADYRNNLWRERIVELTAQQAANSQAMRDFDKYVRDLRPFIQEVITESYNAIPQIVGNLAGAKVIRDTTRTTPELQASITKAGGVNQAIAAGTLSRQEAVSLGVDNDAVTAVLASVIPEVTVTIGAGSPGIPTGDFNIASNNKYTSPAITAEIRVRDAKEELRRAQQKAQRSSNTPQQNEVWAAAVVEAQGQIERWEVERENILRLWNIEEARGSTTGTFNVNDPTANLTKEQRQIRDLQILDSFTYTPSQVKAADFPEGTRFQLLNTSGQSVGFAAGQEAINAAIQQGFTVQPVKLSTQAILLPTAAELRAMPAEEAEAIRTASISQAQQLRANIGPDSAPEDFEGGIDEPKQQIRLRLESAGVLDSANNTIDIPAAINAGFTSQAIQTATGLGPIAVTAAQLEATSVDRLAAGEGLKFLSSIPRTSPVDTSVPTTQPVSMDFDRIIADQNKLVNALAQVQGPIPAGWEFELQKVDALIDVKDGVSSGRLTNDEGLEIAQAIQEQGATAEVTDLLELVPGYGDYVRFGRAQESGFAVPETFSFGTGVVLNLLLIAGAVKAAPVAFRATAARVTGARVGPLTRTSSVDFSTSSGPQAAKMFAQASREIPNTTLTVEASTPGDLAHITRASSLKGEMVQAVLENRSSTALARIGEAQPASGLTTGPKSVEILMRTDGDLVQGAVSLERMFNAPDPALQQGVLTNRVVVVEGPLAAQRISEFAQAARATNWDAITIRTIAKEGDNLPHLAGAELAKALRREGIKVTREGLTTTEITPGAEGSRTLVEAPRRVGVILKPEAGPSQPALQSGVRSLNPGEVLLSADATTQTGQVVRSPGQLQVGSTAAMIERLSPTLRQDLTMRLGETRAVEILQRLGTQGDQPATTIFAEVAPEEIVGVIEASLLTEGELATGTGVEPSGLSPGERQSLVMLFESSRPVIQTRQAAQTSFAERQLRLRELVATGSETPEPLAPIVKGVQTLEPVQRTAPSPLVQFDEQVAAQAQVQRQLQTEPVQARQAQVAERVATPEREAQLAELQRIADTSLTSIGETADVVGVSGDVRVDPILSSVEPLLESGDTVQRTAAATLIALLPSLGTRTLDEVELQDIQDASEAILTPPQQQSVALIVSAPAPAPAPTTERQIIAGGRPTIRTSVLPVDNRQPRPTPTPSEFELRQPAPAPAPEPTPFPSPAPTPAPTPSPSPEPFPEPSPVPFPQPQPQPFPEPTPTPFPTPEPGAPEGPPKPPRPGRGDDYDEELERNRAAGLNLRIAGINRGFLDTTVDFASGEVNTVPDLVGVPEIPTRQSFTPISYSEAKPTLQRIPWGANDLILGPFGSFKWVKANAPLPATTELLPASEFGNGNNHGASTPKRSRNTMQSRSSVNIKRRGRGL